MTPATAIALSGLTAATLKLNTSASNIANVDDTSPVGSTGGYQPLQVQNSAAPGGGVIAKAVTVKPASLLAYDPSSPVANAQGLVQAPEIDPITEVTNQLAASQAFAYQLKVLQTANENEKTLLNLQT